MPSYITLSIVDDVNSCDCCGKTNLKSTVAMQREDGTIFHFGSVCATRHSGRDAKTIKQEAFAAYNAKVELAKAEFAKTDEEVAFRATLDQARRLQIAVGKAFRDFTRSAADKADLKRAEIASKYGLSIYAV